MTEKKLTDRQLAWLYTTIAKSYEEKRLCPNLDVTFNSLYDMVTNILYHNPDNDFYALPPQEKLKAYQVLRTFFVACPPYWQKNAVHAFEPARVVNITDTPPPYLDPQSHRQVVVIYPTHDNWLTNYLLLRALTDRPPVSVPPVRNVDAHGRNKDDNTSLIAALAAMALVASVIIATWFAMYYMLTEACDNTTRFIYNEGWLQASITLISMPISACITYLLANSFAYAPLSSLFFAAGFANPITMATVVVTCLTLVGAGVGTWASNKTQQIIRQRTHTEALDSKDPYRYILTDSEEEQLSLDGIDPLKVKCVMIALRGAIARESANSFFSNNINSQPLRIIRQLRHGEVNFVHIEGLNFDCRTDAAMDANPLNIEPILMRQKEAIFTENFPSKPPAYQARADFISDSGAPSAPAFA